jgi:hypothetical protein
LPLVVILIVPAWRSYSKREFPESPLVDDMRPDSKFAEDRSGIGR